MSIPSIEVSSAALGAQTLASSPVVRHADRWWLVAGPLSVLSSDPAFNQNLDDFAGAMAEADRSVTQALPRLRAALVARGNSR